MIGVTMARGIVKAGAFAVPAGQVVALAVWWWVASRPVRTDFDRFVDHTTVYLFVPTLVALGAMAVFLLRRAEVPLIPRRLLISATTASVATVCLIGMLEMMLIAVPDPY